MPSAEYYAEKRARKLAAIEAAKAPEDRLVNRDWDDEVQRKIGIHTRNQHKRSRTKFVRTVSSPDVKLYSLEEAERFFDNGGPKFSCRIIKAFLEAYALTMTGTIKEIPSVRSLEHLLLGLFGAAKTAKNEVDKEVKRNMMIWISSDMVKRGLAHHEQREKPVALAQDVSRLLAQFLDPDFCSSQSTTRDILTFALTTNLMVDCNDRISELLRPSMSTEDWMEWKAENPEKIFTWSAIELFGFPRIGDKLQIQARATFRGLKNTGQKGNRVKRIPLRLLPLQLAAEDSLRWLLILGLIDGVFSDYSAWAQLEAADFPEDGRKIHIKPDKRDLPVLRNAVRKPNANAPLIEEDVMRYQQYTKQLADLSRYMGIEHKILPGFLRRGGAYILALHASHEERCARMGHSDKDTSYWGAYRNTTSSIDFQALRLHLEEEPTIRVSSALLNRAEKPPESVSEKGISLVHQDEELLELLKTQCDLGDLLIEKYGSIDAAAQSNDSGLLPQYRKTRELYVKREGHLLIKQFNVEWKEFFQNSDISPIDVQKPTLQISGDSGINAMIAAADEEDNQLQNIDPALLAEDIRNANASAGALVADLEVSDTVRIDVVDSQAIVQNPTNPTPAVSANVFKTRSIARYSLLWDISDIFYNQTSTLTEAQFADICIEKFNHLHCADRYYPNQEPLPGTMDCRFCGVSLLNTIHESQHLLLCEGRVMAQAVMIQLQQNEATNVPIATCSMTIPGRKPRLCTYKYNDKPPSHRSHANNAHHDERTNEFVCYDHSTGFDCLHDFRVHLTKMHSAPSAIIPLKTPQGAINPDVLVFWCKLCEVWIPRTECFERDHLRTHIGDIASAMALHGFYGHYESYRWMHPAFCPFCLFDDQIGITNQLRGFADSRSFISHVEGHLRAMKSEETMVCPASVATTSGIPALCDQMDAVDQAALAAHLATSHGLPIDVGSFDKEKGTDRPAKKQKRSALAEKDANQELMGSGGVGECSGGR